MSKPNHGSYISLFPMNASENRAGAGYQDQHVNETFGSHVRLNEQNCTKETELKKKNKKTPGWICLSE